MGEHKFSIDPSGSRSLGPLSIPLSITGICEGYWGGIEEMDTVQSPLQSGIRGEHMNRETLIDCLHFEERRVRSLMTPLDRDG